MLVIGLGVFEAADDEAVNDEQYCSFSWSVVSTSEARCNHYKREKHFDGLLDGM